MKFDCAIMNPPYNNDIYLQFVERGFDIIKEDGCEIAITPGKYQSKGGKDNSNFRAKVVPYMHNVMYYPDCLDIFAIQESSGIAYYLITKNKATTCTIENRSAMKPCINSIQSRSITNEESLWNYGNDIVNKIKATQGYKPYQLNEIKNKKKYTVNINKQMNVATGSSGCWDWDHSCIKKDWIGKGGVLFTKDGVNIIPNPKINDGSGTSIDVFTSDNIDEVKSFISWVNTKFVRFLILINIGSLTMMNEHGWRFVPDPGAFDHIFTDAELYKKHNLSSCDIGIIESTIKERK